MWHVIYKILTDNISGNFHFLKSLTIISNPEPGENYTEILNGLKYVRPGNGFQPHNQIDFFNKQEVNGPNEHAMFNFLKVIHI